MRAYPRYRDSGIEWLGEVPEHWESLPLRRRLIAIKDGTHGTYDRVDGGVPLLSAKNIVDGRVLVGSTESLISDEDARRITASGFPRRGDVLLTIVGSIGRVAVFGGATPLPFQRSVAFLRFRPDQSPDYIRWVLESRPAQDQMTNMVKMAAQGGVYLGDVVGVVAPFPPPVEQRAIAAYLDRETGRIDALVAKKRLLIERLEEYRTVLITRTVTRGLPPEAARAAGLDPSPRLKPSGVEWLGDVPEHWESLPLRRRLTAIKDGTHGTYDRVDDGVPLLSAKNIVDGRVLVGSTESLISDEDAKRITATGFPRRGDVLLTIVGSIGRVAVFGGATPLPFQRSVAFLRFRPDQSPDFIRWVLESRPAQDQMTNMVKMAAQGGVYLGDVVGVVAPFPPPVEQRAITAFLDHQAHRIDGLTSEVETAIERLQEYRTALITAAVTGKIDVRE